MYKLCSKYAYYSRSPEQVYRDLLQRHFIFAFDQTDIDIKISLKYTIDH